VMIFMFIKYLSRIPNSVVFVNLMLVDFLALFYSLFNVFVNILHFALTIYTRSRNT